MNNEGGRYARRNRSDDSEDVYVVCLACSTSAVSFLSVALR